MKFFLLKSVEIRLSYYQTLKVPFLEECGEANNTCKVYNTSIVVVKADRVHLPIFFWTDGDVTPRRVYLH